MTTPPNPYIGPRSFTSGERLYGRDREVGDLTDLLIAERIVLLYSPSGAGKTSLVQAALMPAMEHEGYRTRPVMRVSLEPPGADVAPDFDLKSANRYVLSCLLSLEDPLPPEERKPLRELAGMTLADYLGAKPDDELVIFDQFEEILTVDPLNRAAKEEFFAQLGAALRPRGRWALFSMREDYVAALDPFLRPVPTRLATTYRLDLLGVEGALPAIQQPALAAGAPLTDEAARKLVDDLRSAQVQRPDGAMEQQLGQHLEPVQLQVVCRRMWDRLPEGTTPITAEHVGEGGDINSALAGYYADSVKRIAQEAGVAERAIRNWFEKGLITPQGIRGQILQGAQESHGLDNRAIWMLVATHLVRAEKRLGANWFELAHDRLISPVRSDNAGWFAANLSTLERQSALWDEQRHPEGLLLRGAVLIEAERWALSHPALPQVETEFLAACRKLRTSLRRERVKQRAIQVLGISATVGLLVAVYFYLDARKLSYLTLAGVAASDAQHQKEDHFDTAVLLNMAAFKIAERVRGNSKNRTARLAQTAVEDTLDNSRILLRKDDMESWWLRPTGFLWGHYQPVTSIAWRPDGAVLASGSSIGNVVIWDRATQRKICMKRLDVGAPIGFIAFNDDGKRLITASVEASGTGSLRLLDVAGIPQGACPATTVVLLKSSVAQMSGLLVLPRGLIAAYGDDGIYIWNVNRPDELPTHLPAPPGGFRTSVEPASRALQVQTWQGSFQYDPQGRNLMKIAGRGLRDFAADDKEMAKVLAITPAGETVMSGAGTLVIRSAKPASAQGTRTCAVDWTGYPTVSPDSRRLAVRTKDGQIAVCDLSDCDRVSAKCALRRFDGSNNSLVIDFHPNSVEMASGGSDAAVVLWNPNRNSALMADVDEPVRLRRIEFLGSGQNVIRLSADKELSVQSGLRAKPFPIAGQVGYFALTQDASAVAFTESLPSGSGQLVRMWKLGGDTLGNPATDTGRSWRSDAPIMQLSAGSDRVVAIVTSRAPGVGYETKILTWSSPQSAPTVSKGPDIPRAATFAVSPYGGWLAISVDGGVDLYELAGTRKLHLTGRFTGLPVFGGDQYVATSSVAPPAIRLWDLRNGNSVATHLGEFVHPVVGPDGLMAAVDAQTYQIFLWPTPLSREKTLNYHDLSVNHLILGSGGAGNNSRFLLSADAIWTALWDLKDVKDPVARPLPLRIRELPAPVLSFDGASVAGEFRSETEGRVLIYGTADQSRMANACAIAGRTFSRTEWADYFEGMSYDPAVLPCPDYPPPPDIAAWTKSYITGRGLLRSAYQGGSRAESIRSLTGAAAAYEESAKLRSARLIPAMEWYQLCRAGTFLGQPQKVLTDCDRALEEAPQDSVFLDMRGIARAMAGKLPNAAKDFQSALDHKLDPAKRPVREAWIKQLSQGRNPIQQKDLDELAPPK